MTAASVAVFLIVLQVRLRPANEVPQQYRTSGSAAFATYTGTQGMLLSYFMRSFPIQTLVGSCLPDAVIGGKRLNIRSDSEAVVHCNYF